jgi:hypothetical protein
LTFHLCPGAVTAGVVPANRLPSAPSRRLSRFRLRVPWLRVLPNDADNARKKIEPMRPIHRLLLTITGCIALGMLAACETTPGTNNSTPISVFPTPIPRGSALPTFNPGGPIVTSAFVASPVPFASPTPLPYVAPTLAPPTAFPTLDANWNALPGASDGVQWRTLQYRNADGVAVGVLVARIDPIRVVFRVHYIPGKAFSIQQWQQAYPSALAMINGNYFTPENLALGLVVADGIVYGASIQRQGNDAGMFQVRSNVARVRSLYLEPFNPNERLDQVLQAYPILVGTMPDGKSVAAPINADVGQVSAGRTVIAQDKQGRILLLTTQFSNTKLTDLASWLAVSGLDISWALNLDGGTSTSMYLATGGPYQFTGGLKPVPVVLAVYRR